ncbi:MAG: HD domain-containing protein [Clostridia bacterium]|nr:HD domain-containing protein [Clostridia bacterium]
MERSKTYMQHGATSVYEHSLHVACESLMLARRMNRPVNVRAMVRGALLHDYFLYDWHTPHDGHSLHGFRHAKTAWRNARRDFSLGFIEQDVIRKHMFPLNVTPPMCCESLIVCLADKVCAVREMRGDQKARKGAAV